LEVGGELGEHRQDIGIVESRELTP
jgi:hypothetical protein